MPDDPEEERTPAEPEGPESWDASGCDDAEDEGADGPEGEGLPLGFDDDLALDDDRDAEDEDTAVAPLYYEEPRARRDKGERFERLSQRLWSFSPDLPWLERVLPTALYVAAGAVVVLGFVVGVVVAAAHSPITGLCVMLGALLAAPVFLASGYALVLLSRISRQLAFLEPEEEQDDGARPD